LAHFLCFALRLSIWDLSSAQFFNKVFFHRTTLFH
jgi:hypothetical protein